MVTVAVGVVAVIPSITAPGVSAAVTGIVELWSC